MYNSCIHDENRSVAHLFFKGCRGLLQVYIDSGGYFQRSEVKCSVIHCLVQRWGLTTTCRSCSDTLPKVLSAASVYPLLDPDVLMCSSSPRWTHHHVSTQLQMAPCFFSAPCWEPQGRARRRPGPLEANKLASWSKYSQAVPSKTALRFQSFMTNPHFVWQGWHWTRTEVSGGPTGPGWVSLQGLDLQGHNRLSLSILSCGSRESSWRTDCLAAGDMLQLGLVWYRPWKGGDFNFPKV